MDLDLSGKVVCITGGSRGIGAATASAYAAEKAKVVICARNQASLDEAVEQIRAATGATVDAVCADVTRSDDVARLMDHIAQRYGRLDVLVNNAGTGIYKPFADVTEDDLLNGMSINFFAQFLVTQRALELLKKAGVSVVINVSGRTALRGNFPPGSSCTGPAKAAEVRFSIDLATELAEHGIRVNCVIPGVVKSEDRFRLWESQAIAGDLSQASTDTVRDEMEQVSVPVGQGWGTPQDVANVIVFLSSSRASYVNGAALTVDGGPHTKSYVTQLYANRAKIVDQVAHRGG